LKFIVDQIACCGKGDRNESTNVSISKLIIGTKPKRFDLVRLLSEQKQNVFNLFQNYFNRIRTFWRFLNFKNETRMKPSSFLIGSKRFHTPMLQKKQNGTFVNYFRIFLLVRNFFVCFKLLRNQNTTLQIAPGFSKDKTKRLDNLKIFWKWNKTKAFGQKMLRTDRKRFVSIQNFDLKTFTFDLFWNESSKTEASDLERSLI